MKLHQLLCKHEYHLKGESYFYDGKSKVKKTYVCHKCSKRKIKNKLVKYSMDKLEIV